jgi:hypothetical protein
VTRLVLALLLCAGCDPIASVFKPNDADETRAPGDASEAPAMPIDCDAIGARGRCGAGVLTVCEDGVFTESVCADSNQVCAYAGDAIGYGCVDTAGLPAFEVTGRAEYEDRPIAPGMLLPIQRLPIRGANLWVVRDSDQTTLARVVTADDGSYVIRYDAKAGEKMHVSVGASSQIAARPAKVIRNSGAVHAVPSKSFAAATAHSTDLLATEAAETGQAFNVFDQLILGLDKTRAYGESKLAPITAKYQRGKNTGSFYDGVSITLAGTPDDDGYDDSVILHEFGHYHQGAYGRSDNPGGSHPNPGGDDPRLAWAEGQATYLANAFLGMPYYIDTNYQDGGWYVELEQAVHPAKPQSPMSQKIIEWMVAEILWDVGDSADEDQDNDGVFGDHESVIDVTATYFYDSDYDDRGFFGVDLVEWLDGWLWLTPEIGCHESAAALLEKYKFPYDFGGPASCQ